MSGKGREVRSSGGLVLSAGEAVIRDRLDSELLGHTGKAAWQHSAIRTRELSIFGRLST
jgi:hypothetical protein